MTTNNSDMRFILVKGQTYVRAEDMAVYIRQLGGGEDSDVRRRLEDAADALTDVRRRLETAADAPG